MSYIDAFYDRKTDKIHVVERVNGERKIIENQRAKHVFYYETPSGRNRSIYGHPCSIYSSPDVKKFRKELAEKQQNGRVFESDINPVFRYLSDNYKSASLPEMNICFFDIETDLNINQIYSPLKLTYAPTDNTFCPITAITLYMSNLQTMFTLALCPPTLTMEEGEKISNKFDNTVLFEKEKDLLEFFLELIEDVDVFTSWNGEGYDIPYTINRVERILGKEATKKFCLFDQYPKAREYKKFQKTFKTYELIGRVHLDYLILYQKHNPQQQQSYKLDNIGEIEVGENKVPYDGTLDNLWRNDFDKFIAYNRQDVDIMVKIDKKKQFIELSNKIAHADCILLKTTIGTVSFVEQAIINEMHAMGFVVPNRAPKDWDEDTEIEDDDERTPVVGAYVAKPKTGKHEHVACGDISSLYPSVLRALNMSPETLMGQIRLDQTNGLVASRIAAGIDRAEAWEGIFIALEVQQMLDETDDLLTIDFEDKLTDKTKTLTMTAAQLNEYMFNPANHVCVTANGTIFNTEKDGIIPQLLAKWYSERKEYQAKEVHFKNLSLDASLSEDERKDFKKQAEFWDQRQYATKIKLNALYGALLNESLRFYDERIGQSTTLTGRSIDKHMAGTVNEIITGIHDHTGDSIIYCDTDSVYFSPYKILKDNPIYADFEWSRENIIELCDSIMEATNETFPGFMMKTFNTTQARGKLIKAGRELVGSTSLFIKKKKYAIMMYDKENVRLDVDGKPGKMKIMGLDMKRSDTPKFMQQFLEGLLKDILTGVEDDLMYGKAKVFREQFKGRPSWEKGSPKKVSNMTEYSDKYSAASAINVMSKGGKGKVTMPGHVRGSINWNKLCGLYQDDYASRITDGTRILMFALKKNSHGMTSIAYPMDEPHMPAWFKKLPFDDDAMEEVIIDKKLDNLVGVLNWDLSQTKNNDNDEFFVFTKKTN